MTGNLSVLLWIRNTNYKRLKSVYWGNHHVHSAEKCSFIICRTQIHIIVHCFVCTPRSAFSKRRYFNYPLSVFQK